jgi:hypothetical protein
MKRAFDYEVGELLPGPDGFPGRITSMRLHPSRPMVYFLCRNERDECTIMVALADAACDPWVARMVPAAVMEDLLFDAFVGFELPRPPIPPRFRRGGEVRRVPFEDGAKDAAESSSAASGWVPGIDPP